MSKKSNNKEFSQKTGPKEFDMVVLKITRFGTLLSDIFRDLTIIGFQVISIMQARYSQAPIPICFVKLKKNDSNEAIFKVKYLASQPVEVEQFTPNPELPRCTNCQELGHFLKGCTNFSICAWCNGSHMTKYCNFIGKNEPVCARCGGPHPASYKGCSVYKYIVNEAKKLKSNENAKSLVPQNIFIPNSVIAREFNNSTAGHSISPSEYIYQIATFNAPSHDRMSPADYVPESTHSVIMTEYGSPKICNNSFSATPSAEIDIINIVSKETSPTENYNYRSEDNSATGDCSAESIETVPVGGSEDFQDVSKYKSLAKHTKLESEKYSSECLNIELEGSYAAENSGIMYPSNSTAVNGPLEGSSSYNSSNSISENSSSELSISYVEDEKRCPDCPACLREQLCFMMEHYFSINTDLREHLF